MRPAKAKAAPQRKAPRQAGEGRTKTRSRAPARRGAAHPHSRAGGADPPRGGKFAVLTVYHTRAPLKRRRGGGQCGVCPPSAGKGRPGRRLGDGGEKGRPLLPAGRGSDFLHPRAAGEGKNRASAGAGSFFGAGCSAAREQVFVGGAAFFLGAKGFFAPARRRSGAKEISPRAALFLGVKEFCPVRPFSWRERAFCTRGASLSGVLFLYRPGACLGRFSGGVPLSSGRAGQKATCPKSLAAPPSGGYNKKD